MSENNMPLTIATLLIAAFVHNTAFAQAANYQPYQSTRRMQPLRAQAQKQMLPHRSPLRQLSAN
jgi:hypothetical protein